MPPRDGDGAVASSSGSSAGDPPGVPSIVFVHGAGISKEMWRPQLASLSTEFRVAAFDLPGHGARSDGPFEFETAISVLDDVVADLGTPAVLVGHSLGGYVGLEYAARDPDGISGLVCSGSSADYRGLLGIKTRLTAALYRLGGGVGVVDRWFRDRTAARIRALPIPDGTVESIVDNGFYLRSWGEAGRALVGRNFQRRLRQFPAPVLLVNGETDSLNAPNAERLAAELPNVEAVVLDGAGHLCNLQAPEAYTDAVRQFVEARRPEAARDAPR